MKATSYTAGIALMTALAAASACSADSSGDSTGAGSRKEADLASAKVTIEPYVGQPSRFPIETALTEDPSGKRIAYMDCGTPVCALFYDLAAPAAAGLGMDFVRLKAGQSADTVSAAFDTAATGGFDGVFVTAINPALWERGLETLAKKGIPVVTTGVTGVDTAKVAVSQVADTSVANDGKLLAAYVVANEDAGSDIAIYVTPELPFTVVLAKSFTEEMAALCPDCTVREATIPVATLGNRAPSLIIDDLQANPRTEALVFSVGEQANGLAAAMKTADLEKWAIANIPSPQTLEMVQAGDLDAALGLDLPVIAWTLIDSLARLSTGAEADPGAVADIAPRQFLTSEELTGDVSRGWTGYPDFAARFGALWNQKS